MSQITRSPKDTRSMGARFARGLKAGEWVGLFGDLGSGKTTFVQGMAEGLGIDPEGYVNSPTFTLINVYEGKRGRLTHVDLYRIDGKEGLATLGLEDLEGIVVVEWAEKMDHPYDRKIVFKATGEKERSIEIV